tara:strand:- start:167 stop:916 length:750 start_codon:yes stop_codon:yes gene_type:complete
MTVLLLFDVDGTITESGQKISQIMINTINSIDQNKYHLGIVGGGSLDKILIQLDNKINFIHYFTQCGSVYHQYNHIDNSFNNIYTKNIKNSFSYNQINKLIKIALNFLSNVHYNLCGHHIDIRNGLVYISLIGLDASYDERQDFINIDKLYNYRLKLLNLLIQKSNELGFDNIDIVLGGSVGIAIYPSEFDKSQIMNHIDISKYTNIYYFADQYKENGNDFKLMKNEYIIGRPVDSVQETIQKLQPFTS